MTVRSPLRQTHTSLQSWGCSACLFFRKGDTPTMSASPISAVKQHLQTEAAKQNIPASTTPAPANCAASIGRPRASTAVRFRLPSSCPSYLQRKRCKIWFALCSADRKASRPRLRLCAMRLTVGRAWSKMRWKPCGTVDTTSCYREAMFVSTRRSWPRPTRSPFLTTCRTTKASGFASGYAETSISATCTHAWT